MTLREPFRIGSLVVPNNIFYAPLAGYTDMPFRRIIMKYRPGLFFCEMVKMEALTRNTSKTLEYLKYTADMHPIGAQIVGSNVSLAGSSAGIAEDLGFDVIDYNCGCPVDKVTKDGSGSAMLKNPQKIGEIISAMVAVVKVPVTVKVRVGWDSSSVCVEDLVRIAEDAGAAMITIHGRTRTQGYSGKADRELIALGKRAAKKILVFGNGDIFTGADGRDMFDTTGCDGVLVARGMLGNPWLVEDIVATMKGETPADRSFEERKKELINHYNAMLEYKGEHQAVLEMRRVACWYFKACPGSRDFRRVVTQAHSNDDVLEAIARFIS